MTEISFPPLHDLSPSELDRRKQHLLSEIRREPERRSPLPTIPQLRLRVALPAMAAFGVAAACAVIFTGAFEGSPTHHVNQVPGSRSGFGGGSASGVSTWTDFGSKPPWSLDWSAWTIPQLAANAPYLPLPNTTDANANNVGTVWVAPSPLTVAPNTPGVIAAIYYPTAKVELFWSGGGLDYTGASQWEQTIDGVRALVMPGQPSRLVLPTASHVLTLEGFVPASELVSVAESLTPSPATAP
jgi:hypothetical protein